MVETIISVLNAKLQTTGHFHTTYCLCEKKREQREQGDFVYPAQYEGSGELTMVEFDSAGFAYFRKNGNVTQSVVDNDFSQKQLYEINIPLRLVAMIRRQDIVNDDAYSPDRIARDLATLLTFKNGDLRTALQASRVNVTASEWVTDPEQIWSDETEGTGRIEPDYSRAFIAMTVNVSVLADEGCILAACDVDSDILHLFDFCKPSVLARLTQEQVDCLQSGLPSGNASAFNSDGTQIGPTVNVPNGGSGVIPLPDVTHTQTYGNSETLPNGVALVCDPALPAGWTLEDTNGSPLGSGSIPSAGSDTIVAPDGSVEINGDAVANVPSGGMVNIMVEQDGNPVGGFDPNSNSWVIPSCPEVTLAVSNTTPLGGETITITATPTGFTPTSYTFYLTNGTEVYLLSEAQAGNTFNYLVDVVGSWSIRVLATDGIIDAWGSDDLTIPTLIPVNNLVHWGDPILTQRITGRIYEDYSGNDLIGTFINGPVLTKTGGGLVTYNGVNQRIDQIGTVSTFAFIKNTHVFTFACFIRWGNLTQRFFAGNAVVSTERGFWVGLDSPFSNQLRFGIIRGVFGSIYIYAGPNNSITDTNWHHVAITCNGIGTGQWYVDGSPVTTSNEIFGTPALGTGNDTRQLEIGAASFASQFFNGDIGPNQIWSRQLSAGEITDVFNNDRARYGL